MKQENPSWWKILAATSLFTLSGCANIQDMYESTTTTLFAGMPEKGSYTSTANDITTRMLRVDRANDRNAARNALVRELITESDQICDKRLAAFPEQIEAWKLRAAKADSLNSTLENGIEQRVLDTINPELKMNQPPISSQPKKLLGETIIAMIRKNRTQTRIILKNREEMDIHRYSVKQAMQDVQNYHRSCTVELGLSEVVRATSRRMSPDEKQAKIESLMLLRQTLMKQGLSTRSVQQKIDAVILAD